MNENNKLGTYVTKLMTIIVDKDAEEFTKQLAWDELKRINTDLEGFLRKHAKSDEDKLENTKKQLLQEENKDGKNR